MTKIAIGLDQEACAVLSLTCSGSLYYIPLDIKDIELYLV